MAKALSSVGLEKLVPLFDGPSAIATGGSDVVELAKVLTETAGKVKQVVIKGGYAEGQVLRTEDVRKFASIPPRPALVAGFLSIAQGPVRNFACTMNTFTRNFVVVVDAVAKKRAEEAPQVMPAEEAAQAKPAEEAAQVMPAEPAAETPSP
jgi:large subunit ribosomal protein L10